jgi:fructokinase
MGLDGAFIQTDAQKIYQNRFEVDTIDTVGAGDAFLAGFISNYMNNTPMKEALESACRLGAYVASKKGANPVFSANEIQGLKEADPSS